MSLCCEVISSFCDICFLTRNFSSPVENWPKICVLGESGSKCKILFSGPPKRHILARNRMDIIRTAYYIRGSELMKLIFAVMCHERLALHVVIKWKVFDNYRKKRQFIRRCIYVHKVITRAPYGKRWSIKLMKIKLQNTTGKRFWRSWSQISIFTLSYDFTEFRDQLVGPWQGLRYNFQGEELFSSPGPHFPPEPLINILGPCFNSGFSNDQWSTECIKHDFMLFFHFCKILLKH